MGYCGGGCCGDGYCGSGIEQIVTYARSNFDYSQDLGGFDPHYQQKAAMSESVASPKYLDNIDSAIHSASYMVRTSAHDDMGGGNAFNFGAERDDLYKKKKQDEDSVSSNYNNSTPTTNDGVATVKPFINPWIKTEFIGEASAIKESVEESFEKVTGKEFPSNITIEVADEKRFEELHKHFGGKPTAGLQGFAINRKHEGGVSHVVVKSAQLAHVMLVVGHEIGHLMSKTLLSKQDEEAKAYAFEMAWLKAIYEHNIAGLRSVINIDGAPAKNGLHDVAFEFVQKLLREGRDSLEIVAQIVSGEIHVGSLF
jgi:hypothetical protein